MGCEARARHKMRTSIYLLQPLSLGFMDLNTKVTHWKHFILISIKRHLFIFVAYSFLFLLFLIKSNYLRQLVDIYLLYFTVFMILVNDERVLLFKMLLCVCEYVGVYHEFLVIFYSFISCWTCNSIHRMKRNDVNELNVQKLLSSRRYLLYFMW